MNSAQLREALKVTHEEFNKMADNFDVIMAGGQTVQQGEMPGDG
jgi:hypothetical protein